ncbi:MAG TPA: sialidase family protein, partial [Polyangiaceae bacterium]|nr:sialidase family protein [Polyangiaceae bacterium]
MDSQARTSTSGGGAGGVSSGGIGAMVTGGTDGTGDGGASVSVGSTSNHGGHGGDGGSSASSGSGGAPMTVLPCDALPAPGTWESITPPESMGIGSNAIALDPFDAGVVWLSASASAPGGLYKSTDCAASFTLVSTGQNADAVNAEAFNSLVLDPLHQGVIYASVGVNAGPGTGVLKSTNGGVDWVNVLPPDSEAGQAVDGGLVNSVGVEAANPDHLVVSMHANCHAPYGPVCEAESTDGGATWTLTTVDIPGASGWVAGAGALILDANRWLFTTNDQGIWLTDNRGETWSTATPEGAIGATEGKTLNTPFLPRADGNYYLPSEHGTLRSSDGTTWTLLPNSGGRAGTLASGT